MDVQQVEVLKIEKMEFGTGCRATVELYLVEQIRAAGYVSEELPDAMLLFTLQGSYGLLLSWARVLQNRLYSWIKYHAPEVKRVERDFKLSSDLEWRMKKAEDDWNALLREGLKADKLLVDIPSDPGESEKLELLLKIIDLHGHLAYLFETELVEIGFHPSDKRMVVPPGSFQIAGDVIVRWSVRPRVKRPHSASCMLRARIRVLSSINRLVSWRRSWGARKEMKHGTGPWRRSPIPSS